jgi:ABC-type multidrug transport system fused ATPase/permease subunit
VIAHRLSTIRNADRINVVVSGEIAEKGTHDELMSFDGYYRALVEKQEGPAAIEKKESDNGSIRGTSVKDGVVGKQGGSHEKNPAGSTFQDCKIFTKHTRSRSQQYGGKSDGFNTPPISPGRSQSLSALRAENRCNLGSAIESESDLRKPGSRKVTPSATEDSTVASAPSLSFKNVRFAYPTRPYKNVLDGFSLDLREGQTVALVGPSGGGKSTTVGLLERFYDPLEGSVEYMGHDLKSLNVAWYRDQIGFVGQEPTLFDETIADNVAYGMPGATQEQIEEACRKSYAHDFISKFPNGYQTKCGERGTQLSGGQKQRIAIGKSGLLGKFITCFKCLPLDSLYLTIIFHFRIHQPVH